MSLNNKNESGAGEAINAWVACFSATQPGMIPEAKERFGFGVSAGERRGWRLFRQALRYHLFLKSRLEPLFHTSPRPPVQAILHLAAAELMLGEDGDKPAIVHFWVEEAGRFSKSEKRFVNAILRRVDPTWGAPEGPPDAEVWGTAYSHPAFLVSRWLQHWGSDRTQKLLQWNLRTPPLYVRWRSSQPPEKELNLEPTPKDSFWLWKGGDWQGMGAALKQGKAYAQDPATERAVHLLNPRPGESLLDFCSAPGGKALQIADRLGNAGALTVMDLPGPRLSRLQENLKQAPRGLDLRILTGDLEKKTGRFWREQTTQNQLWDGVLLDVPCSNTGVIARRPDVKYRLAEADFHLLPRLQLQLLRHASSCVKKGGRMVYSTCSIDPDENGNLIRAFLQSGEGKGFSLKTEALVFPGEEETDGAYGALLIKT